MASRRCNWVMGCAITVIIISSIALTIGLTLRYAFRMSKPKFQVTVFNISSFKLDNDKSSGKNTYPVTANWAVELNIRNPNKYWSLSYSEILSVIRHQQAVVSFVQVEPFGLGTKEEKAVLLPFTAKKTYIMWWDAEAINDERKFGHVVFNLKINARATFEFRKKKTKERVLEVHCEGISVWLPPPINGGAMEGGKSKECSVDVWW